MLAEIIKSVTGQSLRKFTDSAIFKPLGMTKTHFRDDCTEIQNRAYSYSRIDDKHFANSIWSNSSVGATNLYTNVYDMSKWIMNFYFPKVGEQKEIDLLTQKTKLNNGNEINYGMGIVVDTYNGWRQLSHAGGDAGYGAYVTIFPDLRMSFMVFSNTGVGSYNKAHQIADLFISDTTRVVNTPKIDSSKTVLDDTMNIKKYLGNYFYDDGQQMNISLKENKLFLYSDTFGGSFLLSHENENTFSFVEGSAVKLLFSINSKGHPIMIVKYSENEKYLFNRYNKDEVLTDAELKTYTGTLEQVELKILKLGK